MDEHEIRRRLEREISAPDFASIWEYLVNEGWLTEPWDDLLHQAKLLARLQRQTLQRASSYTGPRPGRVSQVPEEVEEPADLTPYEARAARAYSHYLALQAGRRLDVQLFRRRYLRGGLLGEEEALRFINDAAYRQAGSTCVLEFLDGEGKTHRVEVQRRSRLDRLRKISLDLARSLPWSPGGAAAFVLTGEVRENSPLFGYVVGGRLVVEAGPWISSRSVSALHHRLQRRVRGGDNRPVSSRALELFVFVEERTNQRGERPSWGELLQMWNAAHPEQPFSDRAALMRSYRRAHRALLGKEPPRAW